MNEKEAARMARSLSKVDGARYIAWVFDSGREVFNREQARRYAPFCHFEAIYVDGVKVADAEMAAQLVTL